jgi:hypothetical protein
MVRGVSDADDSSSSSTFALKLDLDLHLAQEGRCPAQPAR